MAVLNVIKMGNPILREEAKEFTKEEILSDETTQLIQDLYDTMKAEGGIGIAAPQVGISRSVALINIEDGQSRYSDAQEFPLLKIFNPKIKVLDETSQGFWEGCLSVPGLRGYVERPRKVEISFLNEKAEPQIIEVEDFLATVFQHELDHLFGKLYVDRIKDITLLSYDDELSQVLSK